MSQLITFKKARLATAIALISSTTLLTGCNFIEGDSSRSESTDRVVISQQNAQKAEVVGLVQDTNGNPIANAEVSIGFSKTKTDSHGLYRFKNVPVVMESTSKLAISILPPSSKKSPANYLSATVSVSPKAAQIIQSDSKDLINGGDNATLEQDSLIAYITTDGLAVSAGVTVLPALESTVKGVLVDKETGLPIANTVVGLDILGVNGVGQQQVQNAQHTTSYGVGTFTAATNANGEFEFTKLPVDTAFQFNLTDWRNLTAANKLGGGNLGSITLGANFTTTPETVVQNIGTWEATAITTLDDVKPFVLNVNEVRVNAATGLLKDGFDSAEGFTINFSEPVKAEHILDSVYIKNTTNPQLAIRVASAELSADGLSLTIKTTETIAAGTVFEVHLNAVDYQDIAGNNLAAGPANFKNQAIALYDSASSVGSATETVKLTLKTYIKPLLETGAVAMAQVLKDDRMGDFYILQSLNKTFIDLDSRTLRGSDAGIEQLNDKDAGALLQNLAAVTHAEAGVTGAAPTVDTNVARIRLTLDEDTPSRHYELKLTTQYGQAATFKITDYNQAAIADFIDSSANDTNDGSYDTIVLNIKDGFSGDFDIIIKKTGGDDLEHSDIVTIDSFNELDVVVASNSLTLEDKVAPTTVVQSNYGLPDSTSAVVAPNYGNGGELALNGEASVGTPLFNVTARLLTPQVANGVSLPIAETWKALTDVVDRDATTGNKQVTDAGLAGFALYDAKAWTTWNGVADARTRSVGIAFSEDITLTGTPAFGGTAATLSAWSAQNNVVQNDLGNVVAVDLANVTVSDIVKLANDDHGSVIDFSNVVKDAVGNVSVAANNAKVVIHDRLPPFATSAVYKGDSIEVTFNEALGNLTSDSEVELDNEGTIGSLNVAGNASLSTDRKTLTINAKAWGVALGDKSLDFSRGFYDHDNEATTADRNHGALKFTKIADQRGNTWDNQNPGVDEPVIVIRDDVGDFEVNRTPSSNTITATSGGTRLTLTFNFTHRINPASLGITPADNNTLGAASTAALFVFSGVPIDTSAGTATKAVLDPSGRVLTVTLQGTFGSGDTLDAAPVIVNSAWDGSAVALTSLFSGTITVN